MPTLFLPLLCLISFVLAQAAHDNTTTLASEPVALQEPLANQSVMATISTRVKLHSDSAPHSQARMVYDSPTGSLAVGFAMNDNQDLELSCTRHVGGASTSTASELARNILSVTEKDVKDYGVGLKFEVRKTPSEEFNVTALVIHESKRVWLNLCDMTLQEISAWSLLGQLRSNEGWARMTFISPSWTRLPFHTSWSPLDRWHVRDQEKNPMLQRKAGWNFGSGKYEIVHQWRKQTQEKRLKAPR